MATKLRQIYKCNVCGNIIEILHTGTGELVCCNQPMKLQVEKSEDEGNEKHVPIIEKNDEGVVIKVGKVPHPMEEEHYIEWIQIITESGNYSRKFLKPGDKSELKFPVNKSVNARAYCNIHGLWKSQN